MWRTILGGVRLGGLDEPPFACLRREAWRLEPQFRNSAIQRLSTLLLEHLRNSQITRQILNIIVFAYRSFTHNLRNMLKTTPGSNST